jgi:type VI secretion system (T6SS) effector Tae4 (amidase)
MPALPNLAALVANYPNFDTKEEVYDLIGGKVKENDFDNSCVIRVSRALNYSNCPVLRTEWARTVSGSDHKWYAFRVAEFVNYMIHEFGSPDIVAKAANEQGPTSNASFQGHRGIIGFKVGKWDGATGHFDLWDRDHCVHAEYFADAYEVLLWKTPDSP